MAFRSRRSERVADSNLGVLNSPRGEFVPSTAPEPSKLQGPRPYASSFVITLPETSVSRNGRPWNL